MKRKSEAEHGALDLLEEAVHLLRNLPLSAAAIYLAGTAPFLLGFLFFWVEMSASAFAERELVPFSLALALLFCWMRCCQAVFALHVNSLLAEDAPPKLGIRGCLRLFLIQAAVQPTALFALPMAFVMTVPFGWVLAFYQNATVLGGARESSIRRLLSRAKSHALLWPAQNHLVLLILSGFALFVYLNWALLGFMLPQILKMLLGIESLYTRNRFLMFNGTYFMAVAALTYLTTDPILKVAYCLRCFYGESRGSGQDIQVQLRRAASLVRTVLVCGLLAFVVAGEPARGETATTIPPNQQAIAPVDLDKAMQETLHERKFAWRLPRETEPQVAERSWLARFFERIGEWIHDSLKQVIDWLRRLWRQFRPKRETTEISSSGWITTLNASLYVLVAAVTACLAVLLIRAFRERRRKPAPIAAQALAPTPDVADENVGAEMLPEDGWTKLGKELWERGELRLALRAFYLASLAHLAHRNLLTIARFKSNRDYERELRRRGHSFPSVLAAFTENVLTFDRVWYGRHEITPQSLGAFVARVDSLKGRNA